MAPAGLFHLQNDANLHDVMREIVSNGQYRPTPDNRRLWSWESISDIWLEQPPHGHLNVFVGLPSGVSTADDARGEYR